MKYIFIHGLGQNASSWNETFGAIGGSIDLLAPELSEMVQNKEVTYINLYESFAKYCDEICEPINLCGLSLGAILALDYTIKNPLKVKSLILIGGQYKVPRLLMRFQNLIFRCLPKVVFKNFGFSKKDCIGLAESILDLNFEKQLGRISCPTMIICGERDKANKEAAEHLAKYILDAWLQMIENVGHEVNIEAPEKLAEAIKTFILNNEKGIHK